MTHRQQKGQGLVEAVIAIAFMVGLVTVATVLVCDVGLANYYKEKFSFITNHTAQFLVGSSSSQNMDQQALQTAQQMIAAMKLPITNLKANVTKNGQLVTVAIEGNCKLSQNGLNLLPISIPVKDVGSAIVGTTSATSMSWDGWLQCFGAGSNNYVPVKFSPIGNVTGITKTKTVIP
ncbi:MAG: hypothetical protein K2Y22_07105 [Candidatus Obscuribacterales bacterium]|nr:hypothetical protein [Candidatus Obscuribacterales bacterium]